MEDDRNRYRHQDGSSVYWDTGLYKSQVPESYEIQTICVRCGDNFTKYSGDVEKRVCMTCILKEEDPDAISHVT